MKTTKIVLCVAVLCLAFATGAALFSERPSAAASAEAQDVIQLDRRISLLEQRLYSIESRISSVEQQALLSQRQSPGQPAAGTGNLEILIREIELVRNRVREVECGLLHIDERTLSASAKEKRAATQAKDPCRLNPDTPVRLSSRP